MHANTNLFPVFIANGANRITFAIDVPFELVDALEIVVIDDGK